MDKNLAYGKKYNLRLPQEVYDRVEELGRNSERSSNEQIVYMLKTWQEPAVLEERIARIEAVLLMDGLKKAVGK